MDKTKKREITTEERRWIRQAKRGDVKAFAKLYERVYRNLYRFALYTLRNTQDAEDAVSDAVTDAFATIGKLRGEAAFDAWMYRILSNKCMRQLRGRYRGEESLEQRMEAGLDPSDASEGERGDSAYVRAEWMTDVQQSIFALPGDERMIIGMHVCFGYRTREIAEAMQMNENTVRSKESRGLKKLGQMLSDWR